MKIYPSATRPNVVRDISLSTLLSVVVLLTGCSDAPPTGIAPESPGQANELQAAVAGATAVAAPDLSGTWSWQEVGIIILPSDVAMAVFGIEESEGPVMHLTCVGRGELTLVQNGTSFTGTATQEAFCDSQGGQHTTTPPFPPTLGITGQITGRAVHFTQDVGEGFYCPYNGSLTVEGGVAVELNATGRCVVPLPIHPSVTKNISFDAIRL